MRFETMKKWVRKFTNKIVKFIKSDLLLFFYKCDKRSIVVIFKEKNVESNYLTKKWSVAF